MVFFVLEPLSPQKSSKELEINDLDDFSFNAGTKPGQFQQSFSLYDTLMEFCKEKKMHFFKPTPFIDFIPPKLCKGAEWYIYYSVLDPETRKMKRFRKKINHIPENIRLKAAKSIMAEIEKKLSLGWNPIIENIAPKADHPIGAVFETFLSAKRNELEGNSIRSYRSFIFTLSKWLTSQCISLDSAVYLFDVTCARKFMDDIELRISGRTYNNYMRFYRTLWNWMIDRGYCKDNPFMKLGRKAKKTTSKKRRVLSSQERRDLEILLVENNPEYLVMCLLCYYCFIRPKEIVELKVGDLRLKQQVVFIRGEIAKNDKDSIRTIPDAMMKYLLKLKLDTPSNYYLFGKHPNFDFTPGPEKMCSRTIAKYWELHVRNVLKWKQDLQFYSLKDTGMTNMISDGVPLTFVQEQADHSSIAMTAVYVHKGGGKAREEIKKVRNF